ncbi:Auxin-repressed [Musa troglodytarum]|uniref:Auxin-repressed n=1 Tax=Musa troglodytarum TaxID=320322 RepID=A0A9E7FCV9_9LILI|nr:Auxin-repressed [Musa troglodytarum]
MANCFSPSASDADVERRRDEVSQVERSTVDLIQKKSFPAVNSYPPFLSSVSGAGTGLLDQLWDDTVPGPPLLDELRKNNSSSPSFSSASLAPPGLWGDWKRLQRKPVPAAEGIKTAQPRFPTVYDWFVLL